jgi:putative flippase GtrA
MATLLQYLVLVALAGLAGVAPALASAVGYTAGAVLNYWINYRYTFRSTSRHAEAVIKFAVVAVAGLSLNTAIMFAFTTTMQWHYLFSQVLATCVVLIWNFAANRAWTFVQRTPL